MSYNLRETKKILYRLKRSYGLPVRLVLVGDATVDFATGVSTPAYTILNLDRVIKMPASMLRTFATSFAGMAGGAIDYSKSVFIIDVGDIGTTVIDLTDYIEYGGKKWQIRIAILSDDRQSYLLQVEALQNESPDPMSLVVQGIGFGQVASCDCVSTDPL